MSESFSLIVIGAGAGGLVVAIGAAKAGKKVLLVEKGHFGGDCTNFGCIPSKSLIAAAEMGLSGREALEHARTIVKQIRDEEEPPVLEKIGVKAITGRAQFIDNHTLEVEGTLFRGDVIVIAAGSRPLIPKISGIESVSYLTNETIFDLKEPPANLAIIGGGPIGCELGQVFRRLGSRVTIFQNTPHLLQRDDPEASEVIENAFRMEGIQLNLGTSIKKIEQRDDQIAIDGTPYSQLLIATGRQPNVDTMQLKKAEIKFSEKGIPVDAYGRTNIKNIYAVGDITGRALFTHIAENEARTVLRNILVPFFLKAKLDLNQAIPRVTYTDPEVASLGITERQARTQYGEKSVAVYSLPFTKLDRAICAKRTEGFIKIVTKKWSSRILGATIVGPRAGEMLMEISLAMQQKIPLRKLASLIHPYPTYSLAIRKCADQWLTQTILGKI